MAQRFFLVGAGACLSGILHLVDRSERADLAPTRLLVLLLEIYVLSALCPAEDVDFGTNIAFFLVIVFIARFDN